MKILVAEYASAVSLGGTCELEGRAMLATLAGSFERAGHEVVYPTSELTINVGKPIFLKGEEEFENVLATAEVDAGLLIAPDGMQPHLLKVLERNTMNLGSSPEVARLCADKLLCTQALARAGVPVAEIVDKPEPCEKGCHRYVVKPRTGCGSEGVRITSFVRAGPGEIVTRYHEGLHLSASFIVGQEGFLPLTINRQLNQIRRGRHELPGKSGALQHAPRGRDLGGGKEGCSPFGPARVRRDRFRAGRAT